MFKKIVKGLTIWGTVVVLSLPSFATVLDSLIELPANQVWTAKRGEYRSGAWDAAWAQCHAVYPSSGTDNFKKIQVRIVNSSGELIINTDKVVLTEGEIKTPINIKNGVKDIRYICFQFRGNSNSAANALVSYGGDYIPN